MTTVSMKKLIVLFFLLAPVMVHAAPGEEFFPRTIRSGTRGEDVQRLQTFLKQFRTIYPQGLVTSYFGPLTRSAILRFQRQYRLLQTGVVDNATRSRLNALANRLAPPGAGAQPVEQSAPPPPLPPTSISTPTPQLRPAVTPSYFNFSWRANDTITGEVRLPTPAPRPFVVIDGQRTITTNSSAAARLADIYKIVLVDDEVKWTDENATLLFEMLRRLPTTPFSWSKFKPWKIILTNDALPNDVEVRSGNIVRIAKLAFARANPTLQPRPDGTSPDRVFYSNRLYRAVLRTWYTQETLIREVIEKRYGLTVGYGEPIDEFQSFTPDELQFVAAVLEDLPAGLRTIPGFKKIVRRRNGLTNPWQPGAPAIAQIDKGYIEFMDIAFSSGQAEYIQRLVAHEVTHFLWHLVLTNDTKQRFMNLSGWGQTTPDQWVHRATTNFVSDYAATINPDEDFAETMSYYVYNPDLVRTHAPDKYDFIKNVVDGYEYVLLVDKQFSFQVFNLEPDLVYPGKIVAIDTEVRKRPDGDNQVVATLHLSPKFGDGAERAYARVVSPAGSWTDQYFYPVDGDKFTLRADFTISKYAAHGYWVPTGITVEDRVDNRRYESQGQFGWLLFIDNPEEDLEAPVADLSRLTVERGMFEGDDAILATVPVSDKHDEGLGGSGSVQNYASEQSEFNYGTYDTATKKLIITFPIRKYRASGEWEFREFTIKDIAGNLQIYDLKEQARRLTILTPRPDYVKPELDVSSIKITAVPRRPERPDGETDVTIVYRARDDNAGLGWVTYTILKPNGQSLFDYNYHENFYTPYFVGGAPDTWKSYTIKLTLPPGSVPGTWALREMTLKDKAGNSHTVNFVEVGIMKRFDVL